jgi:tripartite-type tricarboxylate transporter receptor subunit TctC
VDTLQSQLQLHNDNKLKIIAVSSVKTNEELPTVTLFNDVIPGFSFYSWYGIGVLKNTATEAKQPILTALRKINTNENYRKNVRSLGLELGNPAQDPHAFIRKEYQRFDAIREQFQINKID